MATVFIEPKSSLDKSTLSTHSQASFVIIPQIPGNLLVIGWMPSLHNLLKQFKTTKVVDRFPEIFWILRWAMKRRMMLLMMPLSSLTMESWALKGKDKLHLMLSPRRARRMVQLKDKKLSLMTVRFLRLKKSKLLRRKSQNLSLKLSKSILKREPIKLPQMRMKLSRLPLLSKRILLVSHLLPRRFLSKLLRSHQCQLTWPWHLDWINPFKLSNEALSSWLTSSKNTCTAPAQEVAPNATAYAWRLAFHVSKAVATARTARTAMSQKRFKDARSKRNVCRLRALTVTVAHANATSVN